MMIINAAASIIGRNGQVSLGASVGRLLEQCGRAWYLHTRAKAVLGLGSLSLSLQDISLHLQKLSLRVDHFSPFAPVVYMFYIIFD
jgi:hypothetical protein